MKPIKSFALVLLLSSFLLTSCDDGGFSVAPSSEYDVVEENHSPDIIEEHKGDGVHGGGDGSNSEDNPEEAKQPDENFNPGTSQQPTPTVDLGNQIVVFKLSFVSISDDDYVIVTYNEDPFDAKYNFAYYTIDNQELDNSKTVVKENVNDQEACKLYLGSKESKTYTIQFYDTNGTQYGKADLLVRIPVVNRSFFNNIINIIEIKVVSIGIGFINQFSKITQFIRRLFGKGNGLAI